MDEELSEETLFKLLAKLKNNEMLIIKFTADWCGPCKGIKDLVEELVNELPETIKFNEIDVDDSVELFAKFKSKKMVNGIPAILGFKAGEKDFWYVPDDSVLGGNKEEVKKFFARCKEYGS